MVSNRENWQLDPAGGGPLYKRLLAAIRQYCRTHQEGSPFPPERELAEELGVSIVQLLRIQSDMQRGKRFSLAEEQANQAAVKILVPVALFILPAVFIILLGPLALQTIRMFR